MTQSSESQREIRDFDVYEVLHMQPQSHMVRYVVATKTQHKLIDVALYEIEMPKLRVLLDRTMSGMPGLCLKHLIENCENCMNFQRRSDTRNVTKGKNNVNVILVYKLHRFTAELLSKKMS